MFSIFQCLSRSVFVRSRLSKTAAVPFHVSKINLSNVGQSNSCVVQCCNTFFFSFSMLFCWSFSLVYKEKSYKLGVLFWCVYVDWDLVQKLSLKFKIFRLLYVVFVSKGAVSIRTEKEHYFFFVNAQNPRSSHVFTNKTEMC